MDTLKCPKYKFHNFASNQGWLLLYDKIGEDGSNISYLLQDGNSIVVDFDTEGNFKSLTDITNAQITVEDNSESAKGDED